MIILESRGEVCILLNIYWTDPSEFLSRDRDCNWIVSKYQHRHSTWWLVVTILWAIDWLVIRSRIDRIQSAAVVEFDNNYVMIKGVLYQSVQSPVFYRLLLLVVDFLSVNCRYIFQYHCIEKKVLKCQSLCGSSRLVRLGCTCVNCIAHLYLLISRWTHPFHCFCLMNKCVSLSAITLLLMFERNGLMTQASIKYWPCRMCACWQFNKKESSKFVFSAL